jgi:hypothetical protein
LRNRIQAEIGAQFRLSEDLPLAAEFDQSDVRST